MIEELKRLSPGIMLRGFMTPEQRNERNDKLADYMGRYVDVIVKALVLAEAMAASEEPPKSLDACVALGYYRRVKEGVA